MAQTGIRAALTLLTAGLATTATAADRYYCSANVTCTFAKGCHGWDIPWVTNLWKDGDTWFATDEPEGGTPVVFTEETQHERSGARHFRNIWQDEDRQGVILLTILPDMRMIKSWQDSEPWPDVYEHTLLGTCIEEE